MKMLSVMSDNFHAGKYNFNLKYMLHSCINGFIKWRWCYYFCHYCVFLHILTKLILMWL